MSSAPVWQEWRAFPDPNSGDFLVAPFGAGVYWLRDASSGEDIYIGEGGHVAQRMTSLLPAPLGHGTRNNTPLRDFVLASLDHVEYTTTACDTKVDALELEKRLRQENNPKF
jgi:hypothetical protein